MKFDGPNYDRYLGDGVYASFDGYHIILDLRGQDSTTRIALEPEVIDNFDKYQDILLLQLDAEKDIKNVK